MLFVCMSLSMTRFNHQRCCFLIFYYFLVFFVYGSTQFGSSVSMDLLNIGLIELNWFIQEIKNVFKETKHLWLFAPWSLTLLLCLCLSLENRPKDWKLGSVPQWSSCQRDHQPTGSIWVLDHLQNRAHTPSNWWPATTGWWETNTVAPTQHTDRYKCEP